MQDLQNVEILAKQTLATLTCWKHYCDTTQVLLKELCGDITIGMTIMVYFVGFLHEVAVHDESYLENGMIDSNCTLLRK